MPNIYDEIFTNSDILNPVSLQTLLSAGKLASIGPQKTVIDLGSGKGYPSLFLASAFGAQVEGYDLSQINVDYANARAKLLNLSFSAKYFQQDLKGVIPAKKYDIVMSLGIEPELFGGREAAFKLFRSILNRGGVVLYTEPVWKKRPVAPDILKTLCSREESFMTIAEMQRLIRNLKFQELGHFVSSKDDWDLYARPPIRALHEMIQVKKGSVDELQAMLDGFKMEYEAAGRDWDVALWVLKLIEHPFGDNP
jgi:cyclopropane fatty-acyl-phospholipid synthase-like methyltransferase